LVRNNVYKMILIAYTRIHYSVTYSADQLPRLLLNFFDFQFEPYSYYRNMRWFVSLIYEHFIIFFPLIHFYNYFLLLRSSKTFFKNESSVTDSRSIEIAMPALTRLSIFLGWSPTKGNPRTGTPASTVS